MKKKLVIVESPAKARTLGKILGRGYSLKASLGHVRDLPRSRLGVDTENNFVPKYVVPRTKSKVVGELKQAVKTASTVYLATDPDREGEAIAWHIAEVTKSNGTLYHRVVFHEITKEAIESAFRHPRSIDMKLVDAQQARRVLDRLVGYKISPLLWRKVRKGLSAGRVQSVALKIIADREREIEKFIPAEYWTIDVEFGTVEKEDFRAILIGLIDGIKLDIHNREEAADITDKLKAARYKVLEVHTKKASRQPSPPFITSTLQQEAWSRFRFSSRQTMAIAQQLYEGLPIGNEGSIGLITYIRTDSTRVASSAIVEAREFISGKYGSQFIPPRPRLFAKVVKGAQEAHEAIRPTKIWREPSAVKSYLTVTQFKLYQIIWQRMVASQMSAASFDNTNVDIEAKSPDANADYLFRASSSVVRFLGFMVLYTEVKDETESEGEKSPLPHQLGRGDELELLELFPEQHFTRPSPRFTEASLIKMLEQWGIGRPSTYAPILSIIRERDYVTRLKGSFQPTELGVVVNGLLNKHFSDLVSIKFTARMEDKLDKIASENKDWVRAVQDFYIPLEKSLQNASQFMDKVKIADELTDEVCPKCGKPMAIKMGRYGKFLACTGYPECKSTKSFQIQTGVNCPECGKALVERLNKKKRIFYGCSNYPDCQFATNLRPLSQFCRECGGMLVLYRQKRAKCVKCSYKVDLEDLQ